MDLVEVGRLGHRQRHGGNPPALLYVLGRRADLLRRDQRFAAITILGGGRVSRQAGNGIETVAQFLVPLEPARSEEHTSELQSLMRSSYAVFCLKKKNKQ